MGFQELLAYLKEHKWQSRYFTVWDMLISDTAETLGYDNIPDLSRLGLIEDFLALCLDRIRERFGAPLLISSGYRCPEVNMHIGGVDTSLHLANSGAAADIYPLVKTPESCMKLFRCIAESDIDFEECILEADGNRCWVHVGWKRTGNSRELFRYEHPGDYIPVTLQEIKAMTEDRHV